MKIKNKLKFFLPESKDLVDPHYDFINDKYHHERIPNLKDVYAHQIYSKPHFDGMLVTKSVVSPKIEEKIIKAGGIHSYLSVPKTYSIMGDCGAFQYIAEKEPIYTCEETCDYYEKLGFDYGITLDHLVLEYDEQYDGSDTLFPLEPTDDMKFRYRISLDNAKKILELIKKRKLNFKAIGSVQGWSPKSYHEGVKELIAAGFDYIAIGGVARASNETITIVLNEIRTTVKKSNVGLHILGVARLNMIPEFLKSNVVSCDSSSTIFQAFKSQKDNYHMPDKKYTAVRIPPVYGDTSPKIRKLLKPFKEDKDIEGYEKEKARLGRLEQTALKAVRQYADHKLSLKNCMEYLTAYEDEFSGEKKYYPHFEKTLHDRPWEHCNCSICKQLGVEVVLLRGNNRNRRRGFHNTYIYYKQFKELLKKHI